MSGEVDGLLNGVMPGQLGAPVGDVSPLDEAMQRAGQQEQAAFRSSIYAAYGVNPDKAARAAILAGRIGVDDPRYVERNLPSIESRVQLNDVDRLLQDMPRTRQWLSVPVNAQVAADAYESLGVFEKFWNELKRTYFGTVQGFDTARAINAAQAGDAWRFTDPQLLPLFTGAVGIPGLGFIGEQIGRGRDRQKVIEESVRGAIASGAKAADIPTRPAMVELNNAKTWGEAWAAFMKDPLGLIFDVTAQSAAQLAVTVGATALTGPAGGVTAAGLSSFGQEFLSGLVDNLQELGIDTTDPAKLTAALKDATLMETVLQRSAIKGGVVGTLDAASLGLARLTIAPFVKAGIGREATNVVAQMVAQAGMGAGGEALGSVAAGREVKPGAVLAEAIGELGGAPLEVAGMRWRTDAARTAREAGRMRSEVERTQAGLTAFDQAMGGMADNPLAMRAPGALGEFVNEVTGPDSSVYLPAEKLREFFQSMPPEQAQATVRAWGIEGQLAEALAIGGDVVMPVGTYAQHVAAPGHHTFFKDDLRLTAAGMNLRDVADFETVYQRFLESEGVKQAQAAVNDAIDLIPAQQVFDDVVAQAQNAGFSPANARQYAALYAARYATRAARLGGSAWEQYQRSRIEIREVLPESLRAVAPDQMDLLLDSMRKGKGLKVEREARRLLGDSLLEFVSRKGGVVDDGGELAAMDAGRWHRKRRGWSKLIQDKAKLSLDDMALDAWEAGYFPEFTERPTIDDLLEAMRDELGGRERRPMERGERPWQANYVDAARDMDELLSRLSLDLKTATNQQIKDAIRRLEAEPGGYEQAVFHGSPHRFDKFSLSAIGTGEGAQAFGWGLYFAGKRQVAEWYRDKLSPTSKGQVEYQGKTIAHPDGRPMLVQEEWRDDLAALLKWAIDNDLTLGAAVIEARQQAKAAGFFKRLLGHGFPEGLLSFVERKNLRISDAKKGALYTVEIPDDGAYLLWDAPLSEQPQAVKDALAKAGFDIEGFAAGTTGREVYQGLETNFGSDEAASKALLDAGLPGLKYLDGGSRAQNVQLIPPSQTVHGQWLVKKIPNGQVFYRGDSEADARAAYEKAAKLDYNYVLFDDSLAQIVSYEQGARGSITFGDGRALIQLFQSRNLSTFLHETGHLWLEELRADAAAPDAPQQVRDDWALVQKFLGLEDGAEFTVEQHEKFAEAAERYFMEGRAPSLALGSAFQRFKDWLVWIYKTVANLGSPMSDEVRGVFDRLIATDAEIEAARDELMARAAFGSADQASMTQAEFDQYMRAVERSRDAADSELLRKVMATIKRQRTEAWKAEAAEVRNDVRAQVDQRPDLNALHYLRTGATLDGRTMEGGAGGRVRLSREDLLAMYGSPTVLEALPKGVPPIYTDKGGAHPDALAEFFGFDSGRELVDALLKLQVEKQALLDSGDKRSVREVAIASEVERVMGERHGDILNDGSIEQEARDALHNDERLTVLALELKSLGRKVGKEASPAAIVRRWAERTISEKPAREASDAALHLRAERRAARAVEAALLKGDSEEAFRQKQQQMISHALYVEAKRAKADVESGRAMLDRYARARTIKSMAQDYLEQIHGLLEGLSLRPESARGTAKRQALREFAASMEADGVDVAIPSYLLDEAARRNFNELSMAEFRGLVESVKQLAHLGRKKQTYLDNKDEREFEALVLEAVARADLQPRAADPVDERGMTEWQKRLGRPGQVLKSADASLLKIETQVDWLDGGDANGPWNRFVFRPIADAQAAERKLQKEKLEAFGALMKALPAGAAERWQEKLVLPGLIGKDGRAAQLLRSELIAVALNTGNESNLDKMLRGEGWDGVALQAALDANLSKDDWVFIQGTWDLIETLWPQIAELERRVNGVEPEKVEPRVVNTPHGAFRGGYYPLVYDPKRSFDVEARGQKSGDQLFENLYTRATTPKGFTKERVEGYARPLWLNLDVVPRHLVEVTHDLAYRETIMEVDRFLNDKRTREAIEGALGREYYKQFRPWLQAIANEYAGEKRGLEFWESFLKQLRTNTTLVGMGFRASTILAQVGGLSDSTEYLGPRWMASGFKAFAKNPAEAYRFVTGKSSEMAGRLETVDRDIRDQARQLLGRDTLLDNARRFAFYGIGIMDLTVSLPTWIGGYNRALSEGATDEDAIYAADKAVRATQGAGATKDLAAVSRRNEFWRLATMFYSYFSHLYQRQRTLVRDLRAAEDVGDYAMIVARSFWLLVVPALAGAFLGGQGPDEDEDVGLWALRKVAFNLPMGVPIVRDVASGLENAISGKYRGGYQYTPAARALETVVRVGGDFKDLATTGEVKEGFLKRMIELPGYALGLPTGQVGNTAQFLWDVLVDGDQNPKGVKDWLDGLVYGGEKKK